MIRQAKVNDARKVAEVHVLTWQKAYAGIVPDSHLTFLSIDKREEFWRQTIKEGNPELWVAEKENEVVGWVAFGPSRDAGADAFVGEVEAIYVHPDRWSSGTGKLLWLKAQERLVARKFEEVTLWVLEENIRAINFYLAAGFKADMESTKDITIAGKVLREVRYQRNLG